MIDAGGATDERPLATVARATELLVVRDRVEGLHEFGLFVGERRASVDQDPLAGGT